MREISATDASKRFADLLDAVEHRGETYTVVRRGRVVATIAPARRGTGADLRRILSDLPPDDAWADDLRDIRRFAGEAAVSNPWTDRSSTRESSSPLIAAGRSLSMSCPTMPTS